MARTRRAGEGPRANARGVNTRARLLEAALASFAARGFHGTSTRDIAEAAGMSPAVVYAHFATKEEVLFRLSLAGHSEVRDVVLAAGAASTDQVEQLRGIVRAFTVWHARCHTHARVVQYEMSCLTPEHAAEIAVLRRETQAVVRGVLAEGVRAGVFVVERPGAVARAILSLGIDVARWYRPMGASTPDEIGDEYSALALRMAGHGMH